ncbi:MAG: hypothetical protein IKC08_05610, partial [Lentisphaeria bacterium]|nr:hypothetical protein [Lentisphaeria bacterium]
MNKLHFAVPGTKTPFRAHRPYARLPIFLPAQLKAFFAALEIRSFTTGLCIPLPPIFHSISIYNFFVF